MRLERVLKDRSWVKGEALSTKRRGVAKKNPTTPYIKYYTQLLKSKIMIVSWINWSTRHPEFGLPNVTASQFHRHLKYRALRESKEIRERAMAKIAKYTAT